MDKGRLIYWGAIVVTLIVIISFVLTLPGMLDRRAEARIAALKAQGEPVSADDLMTKIPDSENGLLIYEKVFAEIGGNDESLSMLQNFSPSKVEDPMGWVVLKRAVDKYRYIIPLVEEAASRPRCRFTQVSSNSPYGSGLFQGYGKSRNLLRFLRACAVTDAHSGRTDDAVRAIESGFKVSESLKEEPTLIGFMGRNACYNIASRAMSDSLQFCDIDELQAKRLFDVLGKVDPQPGYVLAWKGERALFLSQVDLMLKSGEEGNLSLSDFNKKLPDVKIGRWLGGMAMSEDRIAYNDHIDYQLERARKPYRTSTHRCGYKTPKLAPLTSMVKLDNYDAFFAHRDEYIAKVAGDRIFLALFAYHDRFGKYPSSLAEVKKGLGWKLPEDPFSGKGFRYRQEGAGFVLYSLGRNLKDDGARVYPQSSVSGDRYHFVLGGGRSADMVWKWPIKH
ncbi:MAG: hypothetical protein ACYC2Y_00705 [Armatimonadota bacterium]